MFRMEQVMSKGILCYILILNVVLPVTSSKVMAHYEQVLTPNPVTVLFPAFLYHSF